MKKFLTNLSEKKISVCKNIYKICKFYNKINFIKLIYNEI